MTTITTRSATSLGSPSAQQRFTYLQDLLRTVQTVVAAEGTAELANRSGAARDWAELRSRSAARVEELAFPSTKDEDWRFTDLSPILAHQFQPAGDRLPSLEPAAIDNLTLPECETARLVLVNGRYSPELSNLSDLPPGVRIGSLADGTAADRPITAYLGATPAAPDALSSLNTADLRDAAILWFDRQVHLSQPIHVLFVTVVGDQDVLVQPRLLVVAEPGSQATIVEEYTTARRSWCQTGKPSTYLTNAVSEFWLGDRAMIQRTRIQWEAGNAYHVGRSIAVQGRDSQFQNIEISVGASIARHTLDIHQTGTGTHTALSGLAVVNGTQVSDTHSSLFLNHPHGTADQLHKCIADDRGQAVFNGRVVVGQAAQHTDAAQLNRNLLLSSRARVDTKPQLEIIADDVKCSHGATIGQLDENEIFYLRSRGLDPITARNLLLDGFAGEVLDRLPVNSLHTTLARCIACQTEL